MTGLATNITTLPPDMLIETIQMIRGAEFCPDALTKAISHKNGKDPNFVNWMFRAFGGNDTNTLARNTIKFYKRNF